jgi:MFS family permease
LIYSITAIPTARLADRGNRRTVITATLIAWSLMTSLCGLAQSFWQLALARFGVGATEPGALPSAQSLIGDYFPPEQRGVALAALTNGGSATGWLVGIGCGSYVAAAYGWRTTFLLAGGFSLVLAVATRLLLREPRMLEAGLGSALGATVADKESIWQALQWLGRKRTFVFTLLGAGAYGLFVYGMMSFVPSFLVRSLHASLALVSVQWGMIIAVANLVGAIVGGWLSDRLGKRDVRWYAWVPALACALSAPLYELAFAARDLWTFIWIEFAAEFVVSMGIPIMFAVIMAISGSRRRAMACAAVFCVMVMVGGNLGPLFVGALSDHWIGTKGDDSLRYALLTVVAFLVPAAIGFWWAARKMREELEE